MFPPTKKHTAIQTILLHLLPGLIQFIVMILLIPLTIHMGFAGAGSYLAGNLGVFAAMVPLQIGFLLFVTKKTTNTWNIAKVIPFLEKSKMKEYMLFILIILVWALSIDAVLSPIENGLRDNLFRFVPDQIAMRNIDLALLPKGKLIFVACFALLTNGIIAPITEELYFRGYLLPRINTSPNLTFIVSSILFSLYHFFSPWYFFSRLLMTLPIYYWVVKKKNIRFSMTAHLIANIYTGISLLLSVL